MNNAASPLANRGEISFVFFGAGPIGARALKELEAASLFPSLVITSPDAPAGRGRVLTPSPVAAWATAHGIETLRPEKLDSEFLDLLQATGSKLQAILFVVVDYGKILPKRLLDIPPRGTLNMHPSLLPRLRGPSPIRSAILTDEKKTGVSVMLLDEKLDHGPIIAQRTLTIEKWPPKGRELDEILSSAGGKLLAEIIPLWAKEELEPQEQNHDLATYCAQFSKEDGRLDLNENSYKNLLQIRAFDGWPGTYTFFERGGKKLRVKILEARLENDKLIIEKVVPEGKGEITYSEFLRTGATPL